MNLLQHPHSRIFLTVHDRPMAQRLRSDAIAGIGARAAIVSLTRLLNQGLILISPVILVRLLSVEDFGRYREFLVYATVLISIAGFGINSSLLRFVPDDPERGWRFVDQAALLTLASSLLVTGSVFVLDSAMAGQLLGEFGARVALYVLLFVNLDFWEFLWLSERRSYAVLGYTTTRLVGRIVVVTVTAFFTGSVDALIQALILLEAVRLTISALAWRARARRIEDPGDYRWREQLRFCVPFGSALVLVAMNKSLGALFVAKMLGPVALAYYSIGVYVQPVITVLRNSLSDVLLPEMVREQGRSRPEQLHLWRRATVAAAVALIGTGVVLVRFAEPLIETFFSSKYVAAVPIFQLFVLTFLREIIDFAVPLRALDRTGAILRSNVLALLINAGLLILLLPQWGVSGAVAAFLVARAIEGVYLAHETARAYGIRMRALADWGDLLKIGVAAALAYVVIAPSFWMEHMGIMGVALGALSYLAAFAVLLVTFRIPEASRVANLLRAATVLVAKRALRRARRSCVRSRS